MKFQLFGISEQLKMIVKYMIIVLTIMSYQPLLLLRHSKVADNLIN